MLITFFGLDQLTNTYHVNLSTTIKRSKSSKCDTIKS